MQDPRALNNPKNLSSWRAWEGESHQRSGSAAMMAGVYALTLAFVISTGLFGRRLGDVSTPMLSVVVILYFGMSFALIGLAVLRVNAWKRANPWAPPS